MPLFKNDQKEVEAFLHKIDGAKPTMITEEVNRLLKQEKITRAGCKGQMWEILHQYKIYMPSVKNWNAQVNWLASGKVCSLDMSHGNRKILLSTEHTEDTEKIIVEDF